MSEKLYKHTSDIHSRRKILEKVNPYDKQVSDLEKEIQKLKEEQDPQLQDKIQKLMELFDLHGIDFDKMKPEQMDFILGKKAYPNFDQYMYLPGRHDIKKWMYALKDIHYKQRSGLGYKDAIRQATSGWPKMEVYDFLNWLRFYGEGTHMKYKTAQVWYENGQPGYFLHIKPDPAPAPEPVVDTNAVNEAREEAEKQEEKKRTIEKQRQKIIGRLDSAEKLLRSPEGQMFAGHELEQLMEAIYSLKKKVQLVNKLSVSTRLYEDMIVREANVLGRRGFVKAADLLYSVAQTPAASAEGATGQGDANTMPPPASPPDPSGAGQSGTMSGLPATAPGTPSVQTPVDGDQNLDHPSVDKLMGGSTSGKTPDGVAQSTPNLIPQEPLQPKGIKEFIENMNKGNKTEEVAATSDDLEVDDINDVLFVSEAQVTPGIPPAVLEDVPMTTTPPPERRPPSFVPTVAPTPAPAAAPADEPLEVSENDIVPQDETLPPTSSFDTKMDSAFDDLTLADVVAKLERISKTYKTREQPRQLGEVDMALNHLGLASLFPSLSEAQNKALEANNYISTRVDDILSKLRGAMASQEAAAKPPAEKPEVAGVKNKLQSDQEKEQQRKQMRKEQEAAGAGAPEKETPQIEMGELAAPAIGPAPRPLG